MKRACWLGLEHLPRDLRRLLLRQYRVCTNYYTRGIIQAAHGRSLANLGGTETPWYDLSCYCANYGYYELFKWGIEHGYTKWSGKVMLYAALGEQYGFDTSDFL